MASPTDKAPVPDGPGISAEQVVDYLRRNPDFLAANPDERVERDRSDLVPELPAHFNTAYQVSSHTEPYFWGPVSVTLDRQGRLYVLETNRHRFQVYRRA